MITTIRGLSWKNPFAHLMLHGKIETRTWPTRYRGCVLICAAKKMYTHDELKEMTGDMFYSDHNRYVSVSNFAWAGHAIAVGRLVDCRPMTKDDEAACMVKYREGLYCHVYEDVWPIKPFPVKGNQGFFGLTDQQISAIKFTW